MIILSSRLTVLVSPVGRTPFLLYFITIILTVLVSPVGRTVESSLLLLLSSSLISNYEILGLRLALKWASWEVNLTIYTPTELDQLTKGCI